MFLERLCQRLLRQRLLHTQWGLHTMAGEQPLEVWVFWGEMSCYRRILQRYKSWRTLMIHYLCISELKLGRQNLKGKEEVPCMFKITVSCILVETVQ